MNAEPGAPGRRRPTWPVLGLVSVSIGTVALVASVPLTMLNDTGWPWHAGMSVLIDPPSATAEIVDEDGRVTEFTGSPAETQAWLDNKQHELKEAHGIYARIAVGRGLQKIGLVLLAVGTGTLLWRLRSAAGRQARRRAAA